MAGAGNIILNTARGPYRVRRQPRLFGQSQQERSGLQTANDVMATIQNASKIASMVAPFIKTENKAAAQFNDARTNAAEAIEDVRLGQSRDDLEAQQVMQMAQAQQRIPQRPASMNPETHMPYGDVGPDMTQAQAAMDHARNQNVKEFLRDQGTQYSELEEQLGASQMQPKVFTQSSSAGVPKLQYNPFEGVNPNEIMGRMSTDGLGVQPQGIGREVGQMQQQESEQRLMDQQAVAAASQEVNPQGFDVMQPGATDFLRDVEMHPDQTPLSFTTMVEAQQAMQQAQSAGDLNAYNRASQAMLRSNMSDVRPQQWQDLITGGHYRRAQQGLMKAVPPPKGVSALDKMRLSNMESQIADRAFKQIMSAKRENRAQTMDSIIIKIKKLGLPAIESNRIIKEIEAQYAKEQARSSIASKYGAAASARASAGLKREDLLVNKKTREARIKRRKHLEETSDPKYIKKTKDAADKVKETAATTASDRRKTAAGKVRVDRNKRSKAGARISGAVKAATIEMNRLKKQKRDALAAQASAKSAIESNKYTSDGKVFVEDAGIDAVERKKLAAAKSRLGTLKTDMQTQQDVIDDAGGSVTDY